MSKEYHPKTCGNSLYHTGTPICKMECVPCPMLWGDGKCALQKEEEFIKTMQKLINEVEE